MRVVRKPLATILEKRKPRIPQFVKKRCVRKLCASTAQATCKVVAQGFENSHGISFSVMSLCENHCEPNCARASSRKHGASPHFEMKEYWTTLPPPPKKKKD